MFAYFLSFYMHLNVMYNLRELDNVSVTVNKAENSDFKASLNKTVIHLNQ